jgi:putative membrane protein
MAMGAADVVPGVSGGTIAFITGIYEELLRSIAAVDYQSLLLLKRFEFAAFWKKVNGNFLICLLSGIVVSIFSLAALVTYLLDTYPIQVWSLFFGLIIISSFIIMREIHQWTFLTILFITAGIAGAYLITILTPAQSPETYSFIFFSGMLAICAMILPGISGAFILLLLGKYEFMMRALTEQEVLIVLVFVLGCIAGLLLFSRILSYTLNRFRNLSIATLAGIMIGSLNKVWPWKIVISYRLNSHGYQVPAFEESVWPGEFLRATGQDPMLFKGLFFMALGIFIVIFIEKLALLVKSRFSR